MRIVDDISSVCSDCFHAACTGWTLITARRCWVRAETQVDNSVDESGRDRYRVLPFMMVDLCSPDRSEAGTEWNRRGGLGP